MESPASRDNRIVRTEVVQKRPCAGIVPILVFLLIAALIGLIAITVLHTHTSKKRPSYTTDSAYTASPDVLQKMNRRVKPCDNFYEYACGGHRIARMSSEGNLSSGKDDSTTILQTRNTELLYRVHLSLLQKVKDNKTFANFIGWNIYNTCVNMTESSSQEHVADVKANVLKRHKTLLSAYAEAKGTNEGESFRGKIQVMGELAKRDYPVFLDVQYTLSTEDDELPVCVKPVLPIISANNEQRLDSLISELQRIKILTLNNVDNGQDLVFQPSQLPRVKATLNRMSGMIRKMGRAPKTFYKYNEYSNSCLQQFVKTVLWTDTSWPDIMKRKKLCIIGNIKNICNFIDQNVTITELLTISKVETILRTNFLANIPTLTNAIQKSKHLINPYWLYTYNVRMPRWRRCLLTPGITMSPLLIDLALGEMKALGMNDNVDEINDVTSNIRTVFLDRLKRSEWSSPNARKSIERTVRNSALRMLSSGRSSTLQWAVNLYLDWNSYISPNYVSGVFWLIEESTQLKMRAVLTEDKPDDMWAYMFPETTTYNSDGIPALDSTNAWNTNILLQFLSLSPYFVRSYPPDFLYASIGPTLGKYIFDMVRGEGSSLIDKGIGVDALNIRIISREIIYNDDDIDNLSPKSSCFMGNVLVNAREALERLLSLSVSGGLKSAFAAYKRYRILTDSTMDQMFFVLHIQAYCSVGLNVGKQARVTIQALQTMEEFSDVFQCPAQSYMGKEKKCSFL